MFALPLPMENVTKIPNKNNIKLTAAKCLEYRNSRKVSFIELVTRSAMFSQIIQVKNFFSQNDECIEKEISIFFFFFF